MNWDPVPGDDAAIVEGSNGLKGTCSACDFWYPLSIKGIGPIGWANRDLERVIILSSPPISTHACTKGTPTRHGVTAPKHPQTFRPKVRQFVGGTCDTALALDR